jgi:FMN phosphatase YigB (HAD superfamily)
MNDWTPKSVERMTINQIVQVTSELFNFDQFITFIKNQHQIGRAKYVITSYGSKSVIEAFLRRLGIYYLFDHILTPEKFGLIDGYNVCRELNGKNVMLDMISKYYKAFHEEILLIDDSQINIDTAKSARYATIKVDPAKALTVNDGYFIELFLHQKIKV